MEDSKDIIKQIREGKIDINNQSLFFSLLLKGLLVNLDQEITIRSRSIPHFIISTGDDIMYLNKKGQNQAIEPFEISNEDYVYNTIPRGMMNPGSIDIITDQLTSPYSRGVLQYESQENVYTISAEFRRMPVKMTCDLKYYTDSYTDMLELIQQIISKLTFIRNYNINYLGQSIQCSYVIPESLDAEHTIDIDGTTQDNKSKTLNLSIEVESTFPVYYNRTAVLNDKIILDHILNIHPVNNETL